MNDNNNNGLENNNPTNQNANNGAPTPEERPRVEILTPSSPDVLDAFRIGDTVFEVPANPGNFADRAHEIVDSSQTDAETPVEQPAQSTEMPVVENVEVKPVEVTSVPTQQAADIAAGIDGRDFISATESANVFMENGYTPLNPVEHTSIGTQAAADAAAGIGRDFKDANDSAQAFIENGFTPLNPVEHTSIGTQAAADAAAGIGRDFKDANDSAQAFIENGYTPLNPVEHTSIGTQEAADIAAGIDGRDFISAAESARAFEELGLTDYEKQLIEEEKQEEKVEQSEQVVEQVAANEPKPTSGESKPATNENSSIKVEELGGIFTPVFMSGGVSGSRGTTETGNATPASAPATPVTPVPTEAPVLPESPSGQPSEVEQEAVVETPVATPVTVTSVPTQQAADIAAGIDGRDFISATESANVFMENGYTPLKPVEHTSIGTQAAADAAAGIGRDFKDANDSAQAFIENGFTPLNPVEHTSIGTQAAADAAAGIGRDFKDANDSAQAFIENGYTPLNPVEHTSIGTQEAADIAAGIDGRDFISAAESARAFEELGLTDYEKQLMEEEKKEATLEAPTSSVQFTSIPTQQAADIAAGIDGRTFKSATESAQAIIEDDKQKVIAAVQRQKEKDGLVVAPVPVKLNSMPEEFMVDTPLEKGEILLEKIRKGEIDREEWIAIYENEMKKAQAAKLAAVVAAAAAKKEAEEKEKDPAVIVPVAPVPPVAGGTNGIDRTEEEKERLTPVVLFKKAKDSLVQKLKNKKAIATIAATLAIIIALAHSCSGPAKNVVPEDIPEPPAISITVDKNQVKEPDVIIQTQTPVQDETKKEEQTVVQTPENDQENVKEDQPTEKVPDSKPTENRPSQTPSTPENQPDPVTPTPPVETPAETLPEEKVDGFEIVNNETEDEVKLRTQEQYNDQAGSTVRLDENGEEEKQLSGEFMEVTTENGQTFRTDSTGQTFVDGEYVGSVGTEEQVTLPDNTTANVVNLPEEVKTVPTEEPETPVAFVVENKTDYEMVNPDSFAAAQAAVAAGFLDQNPSDLTPEQVAQAYVDHMANNPAPEQVQSQGLGK